MLAVVEEMDATLSPDPVTQPVLLPLRVARPAPLAVLMDSEDFPDANDSEIEFALSPAMLLLSPAVFEGLSTTSMALD